jgi:hypothetical protein
VTQEHLPGGAKSNSQGWERTPVQVPLWWVLLVSALLAIATLSGVLAFRVYGASLPTITDPLRWSVPGSPGATSPLRPGGLV